MSIKIYLFVGHCILIYNHCILTHAKALIGEKVEKAEQKEFSFLVSLMRNGNENIALERNHICMGTLISLQDVLTAEHCLEGEETTNVYALVNSNDLRTAVMHYINWWISYNTWARKRKYFLEDKLNDIAIARLSKAVTNKITPAKVSPLPGKDFVGFSVVVAGWGISNDGLNPRHMEKAILKVNSNEYCENKIKNAVGKTVSLNSKFICTDTTPFGLIQHGDSGGPLIYRGTVIGINRSTCPNIDDNSSKINIHISVSFYTTFITDVKTNFT